MSLRHAQGELCFTDFARDYTGRLQKSLIVMPGNDLFETRDGRHLALGILWKQVLTFRLTSVCSAGSFIPRHRGAPDSIYNFLKVAQATPNETAGGMWYYQNGSPQAVARALRRIAGLSWSEWGTCSICRKIAEDNADAVVDRVGTEMAKSCFKTTLCAAVRFDELMRAGTAGILR